MELKSYILPLSLSIFVLLELGAPFYRFRVNKLRHGLINISTGLTSFLISTIVYFTLLSEVLGIDHGLSRFMPNEFLKLIVALLLFDLWMYIWHRMNHEIPFFWRFHKAHHSDVAMDATTGLRFHPIEVLLSTGARLPIYLLIGVNAEIIITYESLMAVIVIFHHSNVTINPEVDDALSFAITTPRMHRVHHSDFYKETNSNYGTLLSLWDRIFGTFNVRQDVENICIGLEDYRDDKSQSFFGFMTTPFK
ncbi:MAG: sterol desaturase [Denitrovibrio sp.]|nr:MAG: sterol desaturase [Denitrovibrio sp.]